MGVINVTPDSFSDGGEMVSVDNVLRRADELAAAGADIIDIGGESTSPRAEAIGADAELARVVPSLRALAAWGALPISIDTTKARVAEVAISEGAEVVNDISAGGFDDGMHDVVTRSGVLYIAGHLRGRSLRDVFAREACPSPADVLREWQHAVASLTAATTTSSKVWFDPGLGMGKGALAAPHLTLATSATQMARQHGIPVVIGASRKRFVRALLADEAWASAHGLRVSNTPSRDELDLASAHVNVAAIAAGANLIRVHNVACSRQVYQQCAMIA